MAVSGIHYKDSTKKYMAIYCLILGVINIGIGMIQVIGDIMAIGGIDPRLPVIMPPDFFGGICLIVIGLVFLLGVPPLLNKDDKGVAFLVGGVILALMLGIIYLMVMGSDGIMYLIGSEDFETWVPLDDFVPALWVSFFSIPGAFVAWKIRNIK